MPLTPLFHASENQQSHGETLVLLAHMWGGGMEEEIRIVADSADITVNGAVFTALPFTFDLQAEADQAVQVKWSVPNIDRRIGSFVERIPGRPRVWFGAVYRSAPNDLVWSQWMLRANAYEIGEDTVSIDITTVDTGTEPINGGIRAVPSILRGMRFLAEA